MFKALRLRFKGLEVRVRGLTVSRVQGQSKVYRV